MKSLLKLYNEPLKHKLSYYLYTFQSRRHLGTDTGPGWFLICRMLLESSRDHFKWPQWKGHTSGIFKAMKNNYDSKLSLKSHFNFPLPRERKLIVNFKRSKRVLKSCLWAADKRYFVAFIYKCQKCTPLQSCLCLHAIVYYFSYFWMMQSKQTCSFFLTHPGTRRRETNILATVWSCPTKHMGWEQFPNSCFHWLYLETEHLWSH